MDVEKQLQVFSVAAPVTLSAPTKLLARATSEEPKVLPTCATNESSVAAPVIDTAPVARPCSSVAMLDRLRVVKFVEFAVRLVPENAENSVPSAVHAPASVVAPEKVVFRMVDAAVEDEVSAAMAQSRRAIGPVPAEIVNVPVTAVRRPVKRGAVRVAMVESTAVIETAAAELPESVE